MLKPEVSIIVAVRNGAPWVRGCVESLLALHYPREAVEIIFIDNGSTDASVEILREFEPRIRILRESRRGPSATRNAGVRAAAGHFVAITDCDCLVHPQWLTGLLAPLRNAQYAAVGGKIMARPGAASVELFGEIIHDHAMAIEYYQPPYLIGMNMAVGRELLLSIGLFDERWIRLEDGDIAIRILKAGGDIGYCRDAIVYHHHRDTLRGLAREGFLHGYYQPSFAEEHAEFLHAYWNSQPTSPPYRRDDVMRAEVELMPLQRRIYGRLFNSAKRLGGFVGRRWAPRVC